MASVSQKSRFFFTKQQLHSAVLNPQGSKQFLKKIVPMSVSFILHQRVQLDEKNFQTRTYDGIEYKVFKPKLKNATLQTVRDWLAGALEALDKNYLRELYLILTNVEDPNVIFESYKFQFKYMGDDVIQLNISPTEEDLMQSTDSLFRAIDSLKEHPKYQEAELDIKMAITYYEDVTPLDYNPPFYNKNEKSAAIIQQSLGQQSGDYLLLGLLKTGHHTLKCRGKGEVFSMNHTVSSLNLTNQRLEEFDSREIIVLDDEDVNDANGNGGEIEPQGVLEMELQESQETEPQEFLEIELQESQKTEPPRVLETMPQDNQETEPQSTTQDNQDREEFDRRCTQTPTVSEVSAKDIIGLVTEEIQCLCKISASLEHIGQVECSQCSTIQHCVCLGYLSHDDIPNPYICPFCKDLYEYSPMTEHKKKILSIYRLVVAVTYFTESYPQEVMSLLETDLQDYMITKMKECKVVKKQDDDQYIINMEFLRNSHIKGIFANSFPQRKMVYGNPTEDEDPREAEGTKQKKKRYD